MATLLHNNQPAGHALRISWGLQTSLQGDVPLKLALESALPRTAHEGLVPKHGLGFTWSVEGHVKSA